MRLLTWVPSVQQSRLSKLRAGNYDGPKEEWQAALEKTLLGQYIEGAHGTSLSDLECVAGVASGSELNVIWRRDIKGITVRITTMQTRHIRVFTCDVSQNPFAFISHRVATLTLSVSNDSVRFRCSKPTTRRSSCSTGPASPPRLRLRPRVRLPNSMRSSRNSKRWCLN